jgi:hypothetical protein
MGKTAALPATRRAAAQGCTTAPAAEAEIFEKTPPSVAAREPVGFEPRLFGGEGLAAGGEGAQNRPLNGRQIGDPPAPFIRLHVAGAADREPAQLRQVDRLVVEATDFAVGAQ